MKQTKLIAIGGSAGSLNVIIKLLPRLKPDFNIPLVIVLHRKKAINSSLAAIFSHKTPLNVKEVEDKDPILPGNVYLAPADYHLLIEKEGTFSLDASEKILFSRPSIDVTFETAAEAYRESLTCFLLSGANADGTRGLQKVREYGGTVVIQNPSTAEISFMPNHALANLDIDFVLDCNEMATFINKLD
ncbi:chemotaxis protein CheB [Rubrolithibacter danxiaensis]|uniref:chemotaxis protein CheB n=1 Tax=Rubrolithibacter danxiaensis TaxID=3390805 RepID=UPI003BF8DE43